jgi:PAS domain S-box-containing protein
MNSNNRAVWVGLLCFAVGLLAAVLLTHAQQRANEQIAANRFETLARTTVDSIATRMARFEYGLRGMRGVAAAQDGLPTLSQVRRYAATRDTGTEFTGARGFGLIWRVPASQEATYIERSRADGRPDFNVRQLEPHAGERYIITYIEPEATNRQAVGLDIASETRRRTAAQTATSTGRPTITEPITLVQASGKTLRSFLILLPIYRADAALPDAASRQRESLGWSYSPVVTDEVLGTLGLPVQDLWLELLDPGASPSEVFYSSPGPKPEAGLPVVELEIAVYNRRWTARVHATPGFVESQHLTPPEAVAAVATIVAMLLGGLGFLLAQRAHRAHLLSLERSRRAAVVEASDDGIIALRLDGTITDWNAAAERLFGYTAQEALGHNVMELLLPEERVKEDIFLRAEIAAGTYIAPYETQRRHVDGHLIDVSVSAAPIRDAGGRCIGLTKSFRDIRPAKAAQRQLEQLNSSLEEEVRTRTAALDKTARDLRNIIDALPSMIGYWDKDLRNGMANKAYADWFGVDPQALQGTTLPDLLGPELYARNRPFAEGALRGETQTFERSIPRPDGQGTRHALAHYLPDVVDGEVRGFYVLVHDITELTDKRVALEAEKRDKAALFSTIDAHLIVSIADRRGNITSVNERFCQTSGYSADELVGQNHRIINSGVHPPEFWRGMWQTIRSGRNWRGEVCNRAKDGSLYWVDSVIAPFLGADGRIEKIISFRTEITELKRMQRKSEESERFLREITDRLPLSLAYLDAGRHLRFANAVQCQRLGMQRDEILHRPLAELPRNPDKGAEHHVEPLNAPAGEYEVEGTGRNGETQHFGYLVTEDRDDQGALLGYFVIGTDITVRKQAEVELKRTFAMLQSVLKSATQVSIIAVNRDGAVNLFNRGAERLLGYDAAEMVGKGNAMQWHVAEELQARATELTKRLGREIAPGIALVVPEVQHESFDCHFRRKDGSLVPVSLSVTEIRDDEGTSLGFIGVAYDISARLEHEASLRRAVEAAQAASEAKSAFLANMSHEIRTPLNAVIGLAHLLERTSLNSEQAPYVQNIRLSGKALLGIVNDVLDLSKIEAGEMAIERTTFSLRGICSELQALFGDQASVKGLELRMSSPDAQLPDALEGDPTRFRQILVNLLGNAIKFTDRGHVGLKIDPLPAEPGHCLLRIEVVDTGVGIAPEVLPQLFTKFEQGDASTTRRFGGTGLGLSITKYLVELMGGRIGVVSQPGEGSCFWAEIPFKLGDAAQLMPAAPVGYQGARLQGISVLLVDDSDINLQVAGRLLELEGATVQQARNGLQALELVQQRNDFDIVLMDVQMPVMDGLEATRRIRKLPDRHGLPIVALTAGNTDTEHRRARQAGLMDIIAKPIDPEVLVQRVRRLLGLAPLRASDVPTRGTPTEWPHVEGIDAADARNRLAGDVGLFRQMLKRMLQLSEDALANPAGTESQMKALASCMHSLKGSAGTLGARSIATTAQRIEQACHGGDRKAITEAQGQLAKETAAMRVSAIPLLSPSIEPSPEGGGSPMSTVLLDELKHALASNDLKGVRLFATVADSLRQELVPQDFNRLATHIECLEFDRALAVLERSTQDARTGS